METLLLDKCMRRISPGRQIEGIAALLLPYTPAGAPDWPGFERLLKTTLDAGLAPAVNMDTGYVHLLSQDERWEVLRATQSIAAGRPFVGGAFIENALDEHAAVRDIVRAYVREIELIQSAGGTPILFQATALKKLTPAQVVDVYRAVAAEAKPGESGGVLAFELGEMFAPFGQIYSLEVFERLMEIPQIRGLKHSSLDRRLEWQRLERRDRLRPEFKVYTGNDLAIDMVIYGSDYLLGLASFSPDAFARRDRLWAAHDPGFFALNDLLQYLGAFAFRPPVPAYRHSAAQFLKLRGMTSSDAPHPQSPTRPASDVAVLEDIAARLDRLVSA
ncbi:MAG TPA: dihydrodipicolinate synthase family protein [Terriglobia bacterium]|nr:dihydrodipicolinate synthase family protein [Terriglobia bacterium]